MPKVNRVELTNRHLWLRIAAAAAFLIAGVAALAYAFNGLLSPGEPGWKEIAASAAEDANCSGDFVLRYDLGASGASPQEESRALTALYSEAAVKAYRLFSVYEHFDGTVNLYDLNHRPNEALTVDSALYNVLDAMASSGSRALYLGPVYRRYENLFSCTDDSLTADFDPLQNADLRAEFAEIAAFAADSDAVELQLLGDNKVRLHVSEAYLAYAEEAEIDTFVDFSWFKNAFIVDYFADVLSAEGYTFGTISSYDGFTRNLDTSGEMEYGFDLLDRDGTTVYPAATMRYRGKMSIVSYRDFPLGETDEPFYYVFRDGSVRSRYIDPADGMPKTAAESLVCYAPDRSCAEILLETMAFYTADSLDVPSLQRLPDDGIQALWFDDTQICCTDGSAQFTDLYDAAGVRYTVRPIS